MRKKPPGKLLSKTAHQVEREYRIIHALQESDVPAPKAYILCEDTGVIGTAFYIMGFVEGRIFEDASMPGVSLDDRTAMYGRPFFDIVENVTDCRRWHDAILTLAKLHRIDPTAVGLSNFGKSAGFYNRQIKTLTAIATSQAEAVDVDTGISVGKIPHFEEMVAFFKNPTTQPPDRTTLIHGDYKIDNLVFHSTQPKVVGILEYVGLRPLHSIILWASMAMLMVDTHSWEMSTLGHPLSDLANLLSPFIFALNPSFALSAHTNRAFSPFALTPGLPSRAQCIAWYAEVAGWDPRADMRWGDSFGVFRNGVIMHGIAARYALRQASSQRAQEHGGMMGAYSDFAWSLVALLKEKNARARFKL